MISVFLVCKMLERHVVESFIYIYVFVAIHVPLFASLSLSRKFHPFGLRAPTVVSYVRRVQSSQPRSPIPQMLSILAQGLLGEGDRFWVAQC